MKDKSNFDDVSLPPNLAELDAELSSIAYEERPSFGPELEAELARVWREEPRPVAGHRVARQLLAAGVAGLLMVAMGVPSARAALVGWVRALTTEEPATAAVPNGPNPLSLLVAEAASDAPEPPSDFRPTAAPDVLREHVPEADPYDGPEVTFPELADRRQAERLILDGYPQSIQRRGIGGTVGLRMWVDDGGSVDVVEVQRGSGMAALDEAALRVAPSLVFTPARRRGVAVGTWVEFDVVFRPPPTRMADRLPVVAAVDTPDEPGALDVDVVPEWSGTVALPSPVQREAGELLQAALGDPAVVARLGSVDRILAGDPPEGTAPTAWRAEVSAALEDAMVRDPDNPAPLLALGRIRRNQGLRTEARVLFERGLQRAIRGADVVSPTILAELHYERGSLIKQNWLGSRKLGRVPAEAVPAESCAQARSSGGAASGYASVERLVAWNYLCPAELRRALTESFEYAERDNQRDFAVMMGSFRSAVDAFPGHVGANVEILLALADEGRWQEVLDASRRFVWGSRGHPYAMLLAGVALHRMGRTEDADGQFRVALGGLTASEREAMEDIRPLLPRREAEAYLRSGLQERTDMRERFFEPLDPILSTPVNERAVEHVARAVYAHLRFSGVETDAGRIWVRYGRPDEIRVFGEGGGLRTEFWDYGEGPDVTFQRPATSVRMDLTSEARVYVDDLMSVYPHRYGSDARTVVELEGRVVRGSSAGAGGIPLEVEARIPTSLATGAADSLDVGVFFVDGQGRRLEATQGRVPAVERPLSLRAVAPSEAETLVVEIFNRATGQAAALRYPVYETDADDGPDEPDATIMTSVEVMPTPDGRPGVHRSREAAVL